MEIESIKEINATNLINNILEYKDKKVCLMVKSNAYGHGLETVVKIVDKVVDAYGVVNIEEALEVRRLTGKKVIIFAPVKDYLTCKENKIEFMVDSEEAILEALECGCKNLLHLAINVGMNRYGVKSEIALKSIYNLLKVKKVKLRSIYTHFPRTENKSATKKQYKKFTTLTKCFGDKLPISFGGSNVHQYNFNFDMIRLGISAYGYGDKMKKVLSVKSKIVKINYVCKGEYVGYGKKFFVGKNMFVGIAPIGYGDGLFRNLSGKFKVKINGKFYSSVGNICMDCFFVKIDESVNIGDEVEVVFDADYLAKILKTIPYEVLTNLSKLRGVTKIVNY